MAAPPPPEDHSPPRLVLPPTAYTPWFTRVVAFVIDWAPIGLIWAAPLFVMLLTGDTRCLAGVYFGRHVDTCLSPGYDFWIRFLGIALLLIVVYPMWNFCHRQGKTGQSIGKAIMKFQVVSEKNWQPIGFRMSLLRQLAHNLDVAVCYIGYLLPLWDGRRQTIADKMVSTVCVPVTRRQ